MLAYGKMYTHHIWDPLICMNIYASNCVYAVKSNGEMEFCVFLGTKNSIYAHITHVYILGVYVCLWKFLNINLYNIYLKVYVFLRVMLTCTCLPNLLCNTCRYSISGISSSGCMCWYAHTSTDMYIQYILEQAKYTYICIYENILRKTEILYFLEEKIHISIEFLWYNGDYEVVTNIF